MKIFTRLAPLAVAALLLAAPAQSATIGFLPSTHIVADGDAFSMDVVVSDLGGEIVSAYDLDIVFDDSVITPQFVSFHSGLGDVGLGEAFTSAFTSPGVLDLASVSLLSDAELLALQGGDSVTLATLGFLKSGGGSTSLDFFFDAFNDVKGAQAQILPLQAVSGAVRPRSETPVPEPTAAVTFGTGLLVAGWALRRRH